MEPLYLVIKDMSVINANLSSSYFTADLSQNAYLGFSHNLLRSLNKNIPCIKRFGKTIKKSELGKEQIFSIIKHFEFNLGHSSFAGHLNDANHQALNIPMNPPEIKGSIKQTLVIKLFIQCRDEDLKSWVQEFLLFNRFSGGDIQNANELSIEIIKDEANLTKSLQFEKGWVVKDVTHRLVEKAKQSDYSTAFCDFLSTFKETEKGKTKKENKVTYKKQHKGWFYASLAGYQLLETPKLREGARFSYPHAYAEPIIGLHQLIYFKKQAIQSLFWYGQFEKNTYRLKQGTI